MIAAVLLLVASFPFSMGHSGPFVPGIFGGGGIGMAVGLRPLNITGLHSALLDISDPSSLNYGKHLSSDEVCALCLATADVLKQYYRPRHSSPPPQKLSKRSRVGWHSTISRRKSFPLPETFCR